MKQLLITIAALMLVGCGPSVPDISIHNAAKNGNIKAVKQHLAASADVNEKDRFQRAPLHYAAAEGYKEIAELLIAKSADINVKNKTTGTPLHYAVGEGQKEIAELLVAKGADVNAKGAGELTPLHFASMMRHKEIAEFLIEKGADVNAKTDFGTPLDAAIEENHIEIADLLRKHGGKTGEELKAEEK